MDGTVCTLNAAHPTNDFGSQQDSRIFSRDEYMEPDRVEISSEPPSVLSISSHDTLSPTNSITTPNCQTPIRQDSASSPTLVHLQSLLATPAIITPRPARRVSVTFEAVPQVKTFDSDSPIFVLDSAIDGVPCHSEYVDESLMDCSDNQAGCGEQGMNDSPHVPTAADMSTYMPVQSNYFPEDDYKSLLQHFAQRRYKPLKPAPVAIAPHPGQLTPAVGLQQTCEPGGQPMEGQQTSGSVSATHTAQHDSSGPVRARGASTNKFKQTFASMIETAILSSPNKQLFVSEIYDYLLKHFEFSKRPVTDPWKVSVRHTLSVCEGFERIKAPLGAPKASATPASAAKRSGVAGLWTIAPERLSQIMGNSPASGPAGLSRRRDSTSRSSKHASASLATTPKSEDAQVDDASSMSASTSVLEADCVSFLAHQRHPTTTSPTTQALTDVKPPMPSLIPIPTTSDAEGQACGESEAAEILFALHALAK